MKSSKEPFTSRLFELLAGGEATGLSPRCRRPAWRGTQAGGAVCGSEQRGRQICLKLRGAHGIVADRLPLGRSSTQLEPPTPGLVLWSARKGALASRHQSAPTMATRCCVRIRYPHVHLDIDGIHRASRVGSSRPMPEMIILAGRRGIEARAPTWQSGRRHRVAALPAKSA